MFAVGEGAVPVIAPVELFRVKFIVAAGVLEFDVNTLVVSEYATVLSELPDTDKLTLSPALTEPIEPAPVDHVGLFEYVIDELASAANPLGFSSLNLYVPLAPPDGNVAATCVELVYETALAVINAPVDVF